MTRSTPLARWVIALGLLLAPLLLATQAQARVFIGFGFPLYFGAPPYGYYPGYYPPPPPVYYPPPAYYPPPPAYYAPPPAYAQQPSAQTCYANGYTCPMDHVVPPGSSCYCTTAQGRVWGNAS